MDEGPSPADRAKAAAARRAAELVADGMRVGLGTGSTAAFLVRRLGERVRDEGLRVTAVATSSRTAALAREVGIAVVGLDEAGGLDLTIDGADEVDPGLDLIKGAGGALLQEKIVAAASDRMVIIVDAAKRVGNLGASPLPVEVVRFGWGSTRRLIGEALAGLGLAASEGALRMDGAAPFVTDEGHHIIDLHLGRIDRPRDVAAALSQVPGVVETGLFLDLCDVLVVGAEDGSATVHERPAGGVDNIFTRVAD